MSYWLLWCAGFLLSLIGWTVHLLGGAYPRRVIRGVVHWVPFPIGIHALLFSKRLVGAYTLGASICWPSTHTLNNCLTGIDDFHRELLAHELHHAKRCHQFMAWGISILILVGFCLYGGAAIYSLASCGDIWCGNFIEQDAIRHAHDAVTPPTP